MYDSYQKQRGWNLEIPNVPVPNGQVKTTLALARLTIDRLHTQCLVKCPQLLTSTKLRNHVATVAQILNLNYNDLDQLAKFMGHNINVHNEFYRLPESTVQIAKLGKLFLALDKGNIAHLKNKTLDEIDVQIQADELSASEQDNDDDLGSIQGRGVAEEGLRSEPQSLDDRRVTSENKSHERSSEESTPPRVRKFKRRMTTKKNAFTDLEKQAVLRHLHKKILLKKVPTKSQCMKCKDEKPFLDTRSWRNIKDWIYNAIKKST